MIWTAFSTLFLLCISIVASYSVGGFAYLVLMLVATVTVVKTIQNSGRTSDLPHSNPFH